MRIFDDFDENTNDGGFEKWTKRLLEHLGYVNVNTTKTTADEGIDLTAVDDARFTCGIQCKNWEEDHKVGAKEIRDLIGAVSNKRLDKAMFFTTSSFSKNARKAAEDGNVALYDWDSILEIVEESEFDEYEEVDDTISSESVVFEHNKEFYNKVKEQLEANKKSLLILGTGLGKTTTALEYCREHQCNALVICPKNVICDDWKKNPEIKKAITYQSFSSQYLELNYSKYGLVILDEVHHAGASVWGAGVKYLIDNGITVLGLTATEKRLDGIDIKNEFFGDSVVEGYTVLEGINAGILYPFTYVGAYYNSDEVCDAIKEKYGDKLDENLIGKLDTAKNNTPKVREIIKTDMPEGKRKGIIFVEDAKSIEEGIKLVKDVYPDLEYRILYSSMPAKEKKENKEWFENTDEGYLCSINMVSEGIHYSGVNTIFMLRRTSSPTVFEQQIGRVVTLASKENPNAVIFDLVNNSKTVKEFKWKIKQSQGGSAGLSGLGGTGYVNGTASFNTDGDKSKQIIVKEYVDNIDEVLKEIDYSLGRVLWSDWEDDILFHFYTSDVKKVRNILSHRSRHEIYHRAKFLGIKAKNMINGSKKWTKEEDAILIQNYPLIGMRVKNILNRTESSIAGRVKCLGLGNKKNAPSWSKEEDDIIIKFYPAEGPKVSKRLNNRSACSCQSRAVKLGVKMIIGNHWTEDEIKILDRYYPIEGLKVKNRLPGRSSVAIKSVVNKRGLESTYNGSWWKKHEDDILFEFYPVEGEDVAKRLPGRAPKSCVRRANKLGITMPSDKWTEEEDNILREFYPSEGFMVCKRLKGRSKNSCVYRANLMGLKSNRRGEMQKKKVKCVETGEIFSSIKDVKEFVGVYSTGFSRAVKNGWNFGGYHWEYVEEETGENNLNQND